MEHRFSQMQELLNGQTFQLEIWDTAGQAAYENLISLFYRNTKAVIFAFNITDKSSLDKLEFWVNDIMDKLGPEVIRVLVSTMNDLKNEKVNHKGEPFQVIPEEEINRFRKSKNIQYYETSAKEGTNVKSTFHYIIDQIQKRNFFEDPPLDNIDNNNKSYSLNNPPALKSNSTKKSQCC